MEKYRVICGNIGTVYVGDSFDKAIATFRTYVQNSRAGCGRAAGEGVTLIHDGEIEREHIGNSSEEECA